MIGSRCKILDTGAGNPAADFDGIVVGKLAYAGDQDRYAVRYFANGTPQERWFTAGEVSFNTSEANVVAMRRVA